MFQKNKVHIQAFHYFKYLSSIDTFEFFSIERILIMH